MDNYPQILCYDRGNKKKHLDPRRVVLFDYDTGKEAYCEYKIDPIKRSWLTNFSKPRVISVEEMKNEKIEKRSSLSGQITPG